MDEWQGIQAIGLTPGFNRMAKERKLFHQPASSKLSKIKKMYRYNKSMLQQ